MRRDLACWYDAFDMWEEVFPVGVIESYTQIVVNCTGLDALTFLEDGEVYGDRGQVIRVVDPDFHLVLMGDEHEPHPTYIIPRINDIVLGGTSLLLGPDTLRDPNKRDEALIADPAQRTEILRRCAMLALHFHEERFSMSLAALVGGEFAAMFRKQVQSDYQATAPATLSDTPDGCGLRPCHRLGVQLWRQILSPNRVLIHNYGHGGAGVTLSWGCADEVLKLVDEQSLKSEVTSTSV